LKSSIYLLLAILVFSVSSFAQRKYSYPSQQGSYSSKNSDSKFTYDLSASFGNYNDSSYNEINLGLNWIMGDYLNWRNSIFNRFGSNTTNISGLDSSLRLQTTSTTEDETFGFHAFIGPGVRLASENWNAVFGEAGLVFKIGGIKIGGGVKSISYLENRKDKSNQELPKNDQQVFLILSGGGSI
jgi:hypothetical protein